MSHHHNWILGNGLQFVYTLWLSWWSLKFEYSLTTLYSYSLQLHLIFLHHILHLFILCIPELPIVTIDDSIAFSFTLSTSFMSGDFIIFIGVELHYNVVLASAVQWSESATCIYPLPLGPPSHPPTEHWAELPVLNDRLSLATHFTYNFFFYFMFAFTNKIFLLSFSIFQLWAFLLREVPLSFLESHFSLLAFACL